MPGAGRAEFYFIAAMMVLIMILSVAAVVIFFKTYKKEMRENQERQAQKKNVEDGQSTGLIETADDTSKHTQA